MNDAAYDAEFESVTDMFEEDEDTDRLFERVTHHLVRHERRKRLRRRVKWTLLGLLVLIVTAGCIVAWDRYEARLPEGFSLDPRNWHLFLR